MKQERMELAGEVAHILIYGNHFVVLGFCNDGNDENHNCDEMGVLLGVVCFDARRHY